MVSWTRIVITIFAIICLVFSIIAILGGDMTAAPLNGFGKINSGENLNDVHSILQNKNGEIFTLGYTCVQKFNKFGKFIGGAYFDSCSVKQVSDNEFLSLNNGNIVVLNSGDNIIYVFNNNFDVLKKIDINNLYDENDFYHDYPNTDANDKEISLSFFNNNVSIEDDTIKLDAPRNRLFSRDVGMLILAVTVFILFGMYGIKRQ